MLWLSLKNNKPKDRVGVATGGAAPHPTGSPRGHLQHVVQQCHATLLGLGLCELQQSANLETIRISRVAAL